MTKLNICPCFLFVKPDKSLIEYEDKKITKKAMWSLFFDMISEGGSLRIDWKGGKVSDLINELQNEIEINGCGEEVEVSCREDNLSFFEEIHIFNDSIRKEPRKFKGQVGLIACPMAIVSKYSNMDFLKKGKMLRNGKYIFVLKYDKPFLHECKDGDKLISDLRLLNTFDSRTNPNYEFHDTLEGIANYWLILCSIKYPSILKNLHVKKILSMYTLG